MAGLGFDISPGESAASNALGGRVQFGPVTIGAATTQDRALNLGALLAAALILALLLKKRR